MITASQKKEGIIFNPEILPYGILSVRNGLVIQTNSYLSDLIGKSVEELIGVELNSLIFQEDLAQLNAQNSDPKRKLEVRIMSGSGVPIWCEIKIVNGLYEAAELGNGVYNLTDRNIIRCLVAQFCI